MWSCFDWGHWYSWLQNNNIEDIDKVQWFTINETMTTTTTTSRTMKSAINHPQHRSQRQEVGSSASQSHSLQPGMWKVSAELIWYPFANFYRFIYMESFWNWKVSTALIQHCKTLLICSTILFPANLVYADGAMLHKSLLTDLRKLMHCWLGNISESGEESSQKIGEDV